MVPHVQHYTVGLIGFRPFLTTLYPSEAHKVVDILRLHGYKRVQLRKVRAPLIEQARKDFNSTS